jgi:hypothetical protein
MIRMTGQREPGFRMAGQAAVIRTWGQPAGLIVRILKISLRFPDMVRISVSGSGGSSCGRSGVFKLRLRKQQD